MASDVRRRTWATRSSKCGQIESRFDNRKANPCGSPLRYVGKEIGIVVETVSEVLEFRSDNVEPSPSMGSSVDESCLRVMSKVGASVKILL